MTLDVSAALNARRLTPQPGRRSPAPAQARSRDAVLPRPLAGAGGPGARADEPPRDLRRADGRAELGAGAGGEVEVLRRVLDGVDAALDGAGRGRSADRFSKIGGRLACPGCAVPEEALRDGAALGVAEVQAGDGLHRLAAPRARGGDAEGELARAGRVTRVLGDDRAARAGAERAAEHGLELRPGALCADEVRGRAAADPDAGGG